MTTRTRVKKIDADTHFLPPVDMEELLQFLHLDPNGIADVVRMVAAGRPAPALDATQRKHFLYGTGEE